MSQNIKTSKANLRRVLYTLVCLTDFPYFVLHSCLPYSFALKPKANTSDLKNRKKINPEKKEKNIRKSSLRATQ